MGRICHASLFPEKYCRPFWGPHSTPNFLQCLSQKSQVFFWSSSSPTSIIQRAQTQSHPFRSVSKQRFLLWRRILPTAVSLGRYQRELPCGVEESASWELGTQVWILALLLPSLLPWGSNLLFLSFSLPLKDVWQIPPRAHIGQATEWIWEYERKWWLQARQFERQQLLNDLRTPPSGAHPAVEANRGRRQSVRRLAACQGRAERPSWGDRLRLKLGFEGRDEETGKTISGKEEDGKVAPNFGCQDISSRAVGSLKQRFRDFLENLVKSPGPVHRAFCTQFQHACQLPDSRKKPCFQSFFCLFPVLHYIFPSWEPQLFNLNVSILIFSGYFLCIRAIGILGNLRKETPLSWPHSKPTKRGRKRRQVDEDQHVTSTMIKVSLDNMT